MMLTSIGKKSTKIVRNQLNEIRDKSNLKIKTSKN